MALSRTNLVGPISNTSGNFGTGAFTTASFTPANNSLLVVGITFIENGSSSDPAPSFTISGGGWTYTQRVAVTVSPTSFPTVALIYTAPVGTGASMTLTVDCGSRSIGEYTVSAVCYTGYNTGSPTGATASGTKSSGFTGPPDPFSITLSAAPATTSEVFAVVGVDRSTAGTTPGSGYTELYDVNNSDWGGGQTEVRTSSTSTTVDWVDLRPGGGSLFNCAAAAVEIKVAGGTTFTISPTGASTPTGVEQRQASKSLSGSSGCSGVLKRQVNKSPAGSNGSAGALTRQIGKTLAGSSASTGVLQRAMSRSLQGVLTPVGALAKLVSRPLSGSAGSSGVLTLIRAVLLTLTGASDPAGTVTRVTAKSVTGTGTPSGVLAKLVGYSLVGVSGSSGTVSLIKVILRTLVGVSSSSGTLSRSASHSLTGSTVGSGALTRAVTHSLSGSTTPTGAVSRQLSRTLGGSVTPTGTSARLVGRILTGVAVSVGTLVRLVHRTLTGSSSPQGSESNSSTVPGAAQRGRWGVHI